MCAAFSEKAKINTSKDKDRTGNRSGGKGRLSIVGIGPGDINLLSQRAIHTIKNSQAIIGYKTYIGLIRHLLKGKEIISFGMTQEIERARLAIQKALECKKVCIVSSGDPGIYGMAGLVLELLNKEGDKIKVEIIPGIPAACSCASLLGAPIMHDFVTISLSDLLTDKKLIEKRIRLACDGDFVIVFYNPKSKKRITPLKYAWQILMRYKSPKTPVGIVRNAYRDTQETIITELGKTLDIDRVDMFTTIVIGNTKTYVKGKYMITPRGYNKLNR